MPFNCSFCDKSFDQFKAKYAQSYLRISTIVLLCLLTGKSLSEALILALTNPQYNKRLFIELHENKKIRTCCVHKLF